MRAFLNKLFRGVIRLILPAPIVHPSHFTKSHKGNNQTHHVLNDCLKDYGVYWGIG